MVEGPDATRYARRVHNAVGKVVRGVEGGSQSLLYQQSGLVGRELVDVFSLGTTVVLIFSRVIDNGIHSITIPTTGSSTADCTDGTFGGRSYTSSILSLDDDEGESQDDDDHGKDDDKNDEDDGGSAASGLSSLSDYWKRKDATARSKKQNNSRGTKDAPQPHLVRQKSETTLYNQNENEIIPEGNCDKLRRREIAVQLSFGLAGSIWIGREGSVGCRSRWKNRDKCNVRLKLTSLLSDEESNLSSLSDQEDASTSPKRNCDVCRRSGAYTNVATTEEDGQFLDIVNYFATLRTIPPKTDVTKQAILADKQRRRELKIEQATIQKRQRRIQIERSKSQRLKSHGEGTIIIETRAATATLISAPLCRASLEYYASRDICSIHFRSDVVMCAFRALSPNAIMYDAVANHDVLPGVGNIIQVEGLHRSKIHPGRTVQSLTDDELGNCIQHLRQYAACWLKAGSVPIKLVYNRAECGTCGSPLLFMSKRGKEMHQLPFCCAFCQPEPNKQCPHYSTDPMISSRSSATSSSTLRHEHLCSPELFKNRVISRNSGKFANNFGDCPEHGHISMIVRRVQKKDSTNRHRLFRICLSRGCHYFSWAVVHLPVCKCNQKSILRTSANERRSEEWYLCCANAEPSIGRDGCGFHMRAKSSDLAPLGGNSLPPIVL